LQNGEARLRASAVSALGQLGKEAKEAIPALITALKDTDAEVRDEAT